MVNDGVSIQVLIIPGYNEGFPFEMNSERHVTKTNEEFGRFPLFGGGFS